MVKKKSAPAKSGRSINRPPLLYWSLLSLVVIGVTAFYIYQNYFDQSSATSNQVSQQKVPFDFGNQTIMLDDTALKFKDGSFTNNGHQSTITHRTLNPTGDMAAAILVDNPGGSGTFYYLVSSMLINGQEVISQPVLLGDRVQIKSVSVANPSDKTNGEITVVYLDRPTNAPMVAEPTITKIVKYAFADGGELVPVLR